MSKGGLLGFDAEEMEINGQQAKQREHENCNPVDIDQELGTEDGVRGTNRPVAAVNLSVGKVVLVLHIKSGQETSVGKVLSNHLKIVVVLRWWWGGKVG